jgi:hypothetical protein
MAVDGGPVAGVLDAPQSAACPRDGHPKAPLLTETLDAPHHAL